jgi:hypothetical protein
VHVGLFRIQAACPGSASGSCAAVDDDNVVFG